MIAALRPEQESPGPLADVEAVGDEDREHGLELVEAEERQDGDEAEQQEAPVAQQAAVAFRTLRTRRHVLHDRLHAPAAEGGDIGVQPRPHRRRGRAGPALADEDGGQHEEDRAPRRGRREDRRERHAEAARYAGPGRPQDVADVQGHLHDAVGLGPAGLVDQVGDHSVVGREEERPAEGRLDAAQDGDEDDVADERHPDEPADPDGRRHQQHGAAPEAVGEAAPDELQRQPRDGRDAEEQADDTERDPEVVLEVDADPGEADAGPRAVDEGAGDEDPVLAREGRQVVPDLPQSACHRPPCPPILRSL